MIFVKIYEIYYLLFIMKFIIIIYEIYYLYIQCIVTRRYCWCIFVEKRSKGLDQD